MLDRDVRREDIQSLSSRDHVAAFFAALGYNTDARIIQTPANIGITTDSLVRSIKHLERIADQENLLQIYLVELSSVTLASALRNRAGNYLLVLTHDYDRIDFVLIEKIAPTLEPGTTIAPKQVTVRPRILTVERRNPSKVERRVLRRLSYTEPDPVAQYDKLKSAFDIADWSEEHFNNRALFADYYLRERLPELPEWKDDSKPTFRELRKLYDRAAGRWSNQREQDLRAGLIEPALSALGFTFDTEKAAHDDRPEPDYLLRSATGGVAVAVCLAYRWSRLLDGKDEGRDTDTPDENPGAVVVSLLERGDAPFAIVTNGKHWRLYAAKTHSRATNYYEIDLEETLALDDPNEAFRYFWLLFRYQGLESRDITVDGEQRRTTFVDQLLDGSEQYAKRLGDRLKDRIFAEIFPHFAEGFITHLRAEHGESLQQANLDAVFHGTLTFLYRLLFLLYAESRDLLPAKEVRGYFETSLTRQKRDVAAAAGDISDEISDRLRKRYSPSSTVLYDALADLFWIVDRGDAERNVPVYNGGLFLTEVDAADASPEAVNARFLLSHKIPDRHLALGLDLLARDDDEKTHGRVSIDYKSLGVRQLGSIYEGLLEFRLRIAPEKMAICKGKKTDEVVPYEEAKKEKRKILSAGRGKDAAERTLPRGAVYLENDKRERKATGSYYTPDYIVKYIVEHTVGPILVERFDEMRPSLREAQKALHRERDKAKAGLKKLGKADDPEREAFLKHRTVVDRLFDVKVLDPAMGSGHFLVEVVDFITDRLLDFLNGFAWNPVVYQLRETRDTILHELDEQGVTVDRAKLTDVNLLKRHVLKRCIYGVDINPMAVELAKVSLWLDSFTLGAPLSFLDHHLKCGNSLIGTTVDEVNAVIRTGQMSLLSGTRFEGMKQAVAGMIHIGELSDVTAAQVKESRQEFKRATSAMAPAKRLLDVYTSQWFGNTSTESGQSKKRSEHNPALEFLRDAASEKWARDPSGAKLTDQWRKVAITACDATDTKRFFHWELEYPEVFYRSQQGRFERTPDAGFDAVIGNPPWIRQETIQADKAALAVHFADVFDSVADIYVFFLARGFSVSGPSRLLGMIVPNKWHRAAYGEKLRRFLAEQEQPVTLIDFGHAPVFPDADTFPCIVIARNARPEDGSNVEVCSVPRETLPTLDLPSFVTRNSRSVPSARLSSTGWDLEGSGVSELLGKIRRAGVPLREYIGGKPYRGVLTGFNEAFLIDRQTRDRLVTEDPKCEPIIKKFLRGRDIQRWHPQWGGEWMIFARRGIKIDQYPSIKRHLSKFRRELEPRPPDWDEKRQGKWLGRKPGPYKWYEIQDAIDYFDLLEKPKLIYQDIAFHSWFALDDVGMYSNNTCYFVPQADLYLLAVLNSSVAWWYLSRTATHAKDEAFRLHGIFMEELPVPNPSPSRERIEQLTAQLVDLTAQKQRLNVAFFDCLATKLGTTRVTQKLETYWKLDAVTIEAEVRRASASALTPAARKLLTDEHTSQVAQLKPILAKTRQLEIELQHHVFDLYGLTPEEVQLLRSTAPPRDPLALVEEQQGVTEYLTRDSQP